MSIRQAVLSDLDRVKYISEVTISEIYPHYYPKGAVDFFLAHHSENNGSSAFISVWSFLFSRYDTSV